MNHICSKCKSEITYTYPNGKKQWHKYNNSWICHKCFEKYIHGPVYAPIRNAKHNPRLLKFKDKRILLDHNPRTGVCSWCGKTGERTHIHHINYHDDDPLKDTIELCVSCHTKESWRLGQYANRNIY